MARHHHLLSFLFISLALSITSGETEVKVTVFQQGITCSGSSLFGVQLLVDVPLTVGSNPNSLLLGRAQGFCTAMDFWTVEWDYNIVFMAGEFSGSSIAIKGRVNILSQERELLVVGGTGAFLKATGSAVLQDSIGPTVDTAVNVALAVHLHILIVF